MIARVPPDPENELFYEASRRPWPCGGAAYETEIYVTVNHCAGRVCKVVGKVSIFTPLQEFTPNDLSGLIHDLKVNKFSKAAMQAWYRLPPKMNEIEVLRLFEKAGLTKPTCTIYLQGMVAAFTATKVG